MSMLDDAIQLLVDKAIKDDREKIIKAFQSDIEKENVHYFDSDLILEMLKGDRVVIEIIKSVDGRRIAVKKD